MSEKAKHTEAKSAKAITVKMPDGLTYIVAAEHVAHNRAAYYADRDADTTYIEEFDHAMSDDDDLLDWAVNNMNWSDVREFARVYSQEVKPFDYEDGWCNGEKHVIPSPASMGLMMPAKARGADQS